MVIRSIALAANLIVLMVAGDQFVVGAVRVAASLKVRPTVVGAVIAGLGASLPELLVSGIASARGDSQIALGTLVGANVAIISLALGIAALIAPVRVDSTTVLREAPISVAAVLLFASMIPGGLTRLKGIVLLIGLVIALGGLLVNARMGTRRDELGLEVAEFFEPTRHPTPRELARALVGLGLMLAAAEVLVRSASDLARRLGVGPEFIGLTVVALGTSAPQVAIAIQAARRGDHDLVVGNVLGSTLFISLAGGSIIGFLHRGPAPVLSVVPVLMMAGIALASWAFMARRSLVTRWEAGILIAAYAGTVALTPR
jgi:cation:H+ antiporter